MRKPSLLIPGFKTPTVLPRHVFARLSLQIPAKPFRPPARPPFSRNPTAILTTPTRIRPGKPGQIRQTLTSPDLLWLTLTNSDLL